MGFINVTGDHFGYFAEQNLLRYTGGLSVEKFMKKLTWQKLTPESNRSKIKTNSILRRTIFLFTYFQLPDFEEHPDNCFQIDWTEGSAHREDGRNGGPRKVFHRHPHRSSLFLHAF